MLVVWPNGASFLGICYDADYPTLLVCYCSLAGLKSELGLAIAIRPCIPVHTLGRFHPIIPIKLTIEVHINIHGIHV